MLTHLGTFPVEDFLQQYWQQKPLLIRQAFPDFNSPISADELAGLALESEVTSRIVLEKDGQHPWDCRHGPFDEETFQTLPESHWTLLVQDVEKHLPELAVLLEPFQFIPRWRIDDLMISYAADQGSVGPHLDQYDVFLLQAEGQRHWQIQNQPDTENLIAGIDLQILENFAADEDWVLNPGDMLYLPPGIAHHGIALGDCMTFSIGFRAPTAAELLNSMAHDLAEVFESNLRFQDTLLNMQSDSGQLTEQSIQSLTDLMIEAIHQPAFVQGVIAKHLSEPAPVMPNYEVHKEDFETFKLLLTQSTSINFHPALRMLYTVQEQGVEWFVDGEQIPAHTADAGAVKTICNEYKIASEILANSHSLLAPAFNLYLIGGIEFED